MPRAFALRFALLATTAALACDQPAPVSTAQTDITCAPGTTGMILWLRAGELPLTDGAPVATWPDVSTQNNPAAQSSAARRPTFAASSIGGHPAVRFDGSDDRLDLALNTFASGNFPLSVIAVLRTADTDAHIAGTGSSSAGFLGSYGSALTLVGGSPVIKANQSSSGLHLQATTAIAGPTAPPHIVTAIAQAGASTIYVDSQLAGASNAATNAYPYAKSTLGASDGSLSNASRDPFAGDLAELIVYQRALSLGERTDLENCLGEKYAVDILGCDGVPNSGLVRDACGTCGGDGSSCAAVTPDQLVLWMRADDLALATGTGVASWTDASPSQNHAAQNTAGRRPTMTANAIGGHAAVHFDGVDDRLDLAFNTFATGNFPLTVFAVLSTSDGQGHIAGTGSSSAGFLTTYGGALTLVGGSPVIKANSGGAGLHLSASSAINSGTPRIVSSVARAGLNTVFVDCAVAGVSGAAPGAYAYGKSTIGASDGSNSNAVIDPFGGSLAELIVYKRALDDPERAAIEDYLVAKYGLATCNHVLPDPAITLANSAVMFFKMDESGTIPRADSAAGLHVLPFPPDAAGIFAEPGIVGSAQNVNGPSGYHFFRSSAHAMNHGGGSFTWAGWMKLASFYSDQTFVGKWHNDTHNRREYRVWFDLLSSKFEFEVSGTGAAGPGHSARVVHPAEIALNTYYFIEAWHDAAADTLNLRIGTTGSRGSVASVPWSGGARFDSADLNIGAHNTCADAHLHGSIDAVGYWTRVLSPAESLRLWNDGAGFEP